MGLKTRSKGTRIVRSTPWTSHQMPSERCHAEGPFGPLFYNHMVMKGPYNITLLHFPSRQLPKISPRKVGRNLSGILKWNKGRSVLWLHKYVNSTIKIQTRLSISGTSQVYSFSYSPWTGQQGNKSRSSSSLSAVIEQTMAQEWWHTSPSAPVRLACEEEAMALCAGSCLLCPGRLSRDLQLPWEGNTDVAISSLCHHNTFHLVPFVGKIKV